MNIGAYTFEEFKQLAENFHSYAAPGLLIGGYMVAFAKEHIGEDVLFEAVVETRKCLPDAVQLLTPCSTGNNWMKVLNLGLYAVSLYDKYTGEGVRVSLSSKKLKEYPEILSWFLKQKPKAEQDVDQLEKEIRQAGTSLCLVKPIKIKNSFLGKSHMEGIVFCPLCDEAYPSTDGKICRSCQGEAPYVLVGKELNLRTKQRIVPVEKAVGMTLSHDLTRIEPGAFKGPEFKEGQRISTHDLCRLQQMGRFHLAVKEDFEVSDDVVHENEVATLFAQRMAGTGVTYSLPPQEGKIDFVAMSDGLFCVDLERMKQFNMVGDVMVASRHHASLISKGTKIAGTRSIPLYLDKDKLGQALSILDNKAIFEVLPLRKAKIGVLITGTEIFQGIVQDKFLPVIQAKAKQYDCEIVKSSIVKDDIEDIKKAIDEIREAGADMLITTGGLSVDPDDLTRQALMEAGLYDLIHGVPVLPGAMSILGKMPGKTGTKVPEIQVIGVPACALYFKTTFFDLAFPRLLAGRELGRAELASLGAGGYCMGCKTCSFPKCPFGK